MGNDGDLMVISDGDVVAVLVKYPPFEGRVFGEARCFGLGIEDTTDGEAKTLADIVRRIDAIRI